MNHDRYDDTYIATILNETKVVAMVGASANINRPSYFVIKYLLGKGYRVIPINPALAGQTLNGETVYASLKDIPQDKTGRIDMVDIFRNSADAAAPALDAIDIGARFVWMQLGVVNEPAAGKVRAAGLEIVMDHCPAIEYPRLIGGSKEH